MSSKIQQAQTCRRKSLYIIYLAGLIGFAFGSYINAKLLAFLVEVAALQAKSARDVGHVVMMAAQFGEQYFPLERLDAMRQRAVFHRTCRLTVASRRQCHIHFVCCN